jgi:hypothetical protein
MRNEGMVYFQKRAGWNLQAGRESKQAELLQSTIAHTRPAAT